MTEEQVKAEIEKMKKLEAEAMARAKNRKRELVPVIEEGQEIKIELG
jgi:hypothetical protein